MDTYLVNFRFYAPNFKEVEGAYSFRLSIRPFVKPSLCLITDEMYILEFLNFIYELLIKNYLTRIFSFPVDV